MGVEEQRLGPGLGTCELEEDDVDILKPLRASGHVLPFPRDDWPTS